MWPRRLAALALAVALVVAAFVIRDRRDGAGSAGPSTTLAPGATTAAGSDTPAGTGFTLVCATELASLCDGSGAAARRNEPTAATAAAFAAATDARTVASAWLTVDPWPGLSDLTRPAGGSTFAPASRVVVAHSPVGLAVRTERVAALQAACRGTVTLACVGANGGRAWTELGGQATWQRFKPTIDDPTASLLGPASLAAATREQRAAGGITLIDLQSDAAFTGWIRGFLRPADPATSPLAQALVQPGLYDAVVLPAAAFAAVTNGSTSFTFVAPSRYAAELVLVAPPGVEVPARVVEALRRAAADAGWVAGAAPEPTPDANLVAGMQRVWKEST